MSSGCTAIQTASTAQPGGAVAVPRQVRTHPTITSQLPIEHWHAWVGDTTIADAILDR
jgi:hypothetical protein